MKVIFEKRKINDKFLAKTGFLCVFNLYGVSHMKYRPATATTSFIVTLKNRADI